MVQTILAIRSEFRLLLYYTRFMRKVKITMPDTILILICERHSKNHTKQADAM